MLQERCRPLAQSGVIEAPRVQLENGLLRTKQKPTSLPTLHDNTRSRGAAKKFHTRRVGTTGEQLDNIKGVSGAAGETDRMAAEVLGAARGLWHQAEILTAELNAFAARMRAA